MAGIAKWTYFFPRPIIPYITPVAKIRPLPNKLPSPKQNKIPGKANLENKIYIGIRRWCVFLFRTIRVFKKKIFF